MGQQIGSYIDDDLYQLIEAIAEYHDIPTSRVVELLLREGVQARNLRYRFEQLDAKLDVFIESLGGEHAAEETVEQRLKKVGERGLPAGVTGVDLADKPLPIFQAGGELPDRSMDELDVQRLLGERDAVEQDSDLADQESDG